MLYHLIPVNSTRSSQVFLPFQVSGQFFPPFLPFLERCDLITLHSDASISCFYCCAEKPWTSVAFIKEALQVYYMSRYCLEYGWET